MNNINLNSHCVNANIKAHILSDNQMETAGFRYIKSYNKNNLRFLQDISIEELTEINGIGKVRLQMVCLAIVAVLYIPLLLFFINTLHLGIISIPLAQLFSNFYSLFIARVQYNKLISGNAYGIWNK